MSCQPSPSKSATHTPGPNSSRLIEMPLFPLKCLNLIPAAAVTFANSIGTARVFCAGSFETTMKNNGVKQSIRMRRKLLGIDHFRGLQPLFECLDMRQSMSRLASFEHSTWMEGRSLCFAVLYLFFWPHEFQQAKSCGHMEAVAHGGLPRNLVASRSRSLTAEEVDAQNTARCGRASIDRGIRNF